MEVRSFFAQKLCHGLSPHKVWSNIDKRRGHLPPCLMGILPLLGTSLWMNDRALKKEAEQLLQEVFFSRYYDQHKALLISQGTVSGFLGRMCKNFCIPLRKSHYVF